MTVSDAVFEYATAAITEDPYGNGPTSVQSGALSVTGSQFTNDQTGIDLGLYWVATLSVDNTTFSQLSTAVYLSGDLTARLATVDIHNVSLGLSAGSGTSVTLRGTLQSATRGIVACDWASTCGVDATYVSWDSATGPPTSGSPLFVCGAVEVDPWVGGSGTDNEFGVKNCDGTDTPDIVVSNAAAGYDSRIAAEQIDCSNGFQDACAAIQTAQQCLSAAEGLAAAQFPVPLTTGQAATAFGTEVVSKGADYLRNSASRVIATIGDVAGRIAAVLGVVSTVADLAAAYEQCTP